jgi:alkaline phosphatase
MSYRLDATKTEEPSLIEMSQKALSILKKNPNGFLLMIEGKV